MQEQDEYFMGLALAEASKAYQQGEVPVGAVVVARQRIVGRGFNQTLSLNDPTAHAEMLAITSAANYLGSRFLSQCTLYVTLEPCPMCAAASYWAQLGRLVYGATDEKKGYLQLNPKLLHPKTQITTGVLAEECSGLLQQFFRSLRK